MQNIPDKGVRRPYCYLQAEYTVTGLSRSLLEVKRRIGKVLRPFPFWKDGFIEQKPAFPRAPANSRFLDFARNDKAWERHWATQHRENTLTHLDDSGSAGILRLRSCFASRTSYSAQDDGLI